MPCGVTAMTTQLTQHMTVVTKDTQPQSMILNLEDMIKMMRIAILRNKRRKVITSVVK
jgi:hypothetical protein